MVRVVLSADLNPISPAKASPTRSVKTGLAGSASMAATTSRVCSTRCVAATNREPAPEVFALRVYGRKDVRGVVRTERA